MIQALIVDDERAGIENLQALVTKYCPQITIAGSCENIIDARKLIAGLKPQLVFLDIEMPFGNGFELLAEYSKIPFEVIFVTAFEKYAMKAIRLSACDYILKPIDINDLTAAAGKAISRIAAKEENINLNRLLENIRSTDKDKKITLPTLHGLLFVRIADIIHCEADGSYTWFYFTNRDKLLVTKNLGEYESLLEGKDFIRVHHAHMINQHHITELIKGNSPVIILSNGTNVPVSQRKRDALQEYLDTLVR
jgi:two-component system LytT family response regulator